MSTTYQLTFNTVYLGREMANVSYWDTLTDTATPQDIADEIGLTFTAAGMQAFYSTAWQWNSISFRAMDGSPPWTLDITPAGFPLAGTKLDDELPTTTCLLISFFHQGARPNRGRHYLTGLTEGNMENGLYDVPTRTAFRTLYEDWANGITVAGDEISIRIARPDFAANTVLFSHPVDVVKARQNPATQRRRRLGVG